MNVWFFALTGIAFWLVACVCVVWPFCLGVATSASIHRWHLARVRANGGRLPMRKWPMFACHFASEAWRFARFKLDCGTTFSAADGSWRAIGDWDAYKAADDET